ncbi:hypothetical protein CSIM01_13851 [Colletotrichum simmondsii]|uniref:Uncharacterized protein n=1 Tax=Colletotrichum simmondsii TaxID=703756 RepID=A0A135TZG4_9PEZI|nr:hypothetical protein CSIM01_13851 [Colletotrichum simmondsii]
MVQSPRDRDDKYSNTDIIEFDQWLAEARLDTGLCRNPDDIKNHGLELLIRMIYDEVKTLVDPENLGIVYRALSTPDAANTAKRNYEATRSTPNQYTSTRPASAELPRKRRRRLPDLTQGTDKELMDLEVIDDFGRRFSRPATSGAQPLSLEPSRHRPRGDDGMPARSICQDLEPAVASHVDGAKPKAVTRIPRTLNGLRQQMSDVGNFSTPRTTEYLDSLIQLREELGSRPDVACVLQEEDYYSIGDLLFCRIFGSDVQGRLYELITEHDAAGVYRQNSGACRVDRLAEKLQKSSLDDLASFVRSWGEVTDTAIRAGTSWGRLQVYWRQYDLWKRWQRLKELSQSAGPQRVELLRFLKSQNIETRHGKTLDSCLADFFAAELDLPGNTKFGDTIYRFAAVGTLVDVFGRGILAFLPKGLDTWYKAFKSGGKLSPKKLKLEVACEFIAGRTPGLRELCDAAEVSIVEKVIKGQPIEMTRAVYDIRRGKSREDVLGLSLMDFVTPEVRRGECSEVLSDEGGGGGGA